MITILDFEPFELKRSNLVEIKAGDLSLRDLASVTFDIWREKVNNGTCWKFCHVVIKQYGAPLVVRCEYFEKGEPESKISVSFSHSGRQSWPHAAAHCDRERQRAAGQLPAGRVPQAAPGGGDVRRPDRVPAGRHPAQPDAPERTETARRGTAKPAGKRRGDGRERRQHG